MLNLLDFNALVQRFAASARASAGTVLNFTVGSVWRALAEANASVGLWIQWLILLVLQQSRLATSAGAQVDSWVADFGMTRLPAVPSLGAVTFSRYTPTLAAFIPVGTSLKSTDGTQLFRVTADTTNAAYVAAPTPGYTLAANVSSITVAAAATVGGSATNAQPGTVTVLASAVAGVDTVSNASAFVGGTDAESDVALKARFALFIQGLSKGTQAAVASAILGVQQGLSYSIAVAMDPLGNGSPGNFVVTVDDGSGTPSVSILNSVYTAVDAVRTIGETFSVQGPTVSNVTVSMTLTPLAGYSKAPVQAAVATAVTAYINGLGIGQSLYYARLAAVAFNADPGVGTIVGLIVNGAQADIPVAPGGIVKAATVAVN